MQRGVGGWVGGAAHCRSERCPSEQTQCRSLRPRRNRRRRHPRHTCRPRRNCPLRHAAEFPGAQLAQRPRSRKRARRVPRRRIRNRCSGRRHPPRPRRRLLRAAKCRSALCRSRRRRRLLQCHHRRGSRSRRCRRRSRSSSSSSSSSSSNLHTLRRAVVRDRAARYPLGRLAKPSSLRSRLLPNRPRAPSGNERSPLVPWSERVLLPLLSRGPLRPSPPFHPRSRLRGQGAKYRSAPPPFLHTRLPS